MLKSCSNDPHILYHIITIDNKLMQKKKKNNLSIEIENKFIFLQNI